MLMVTPDQLELIAGIVYQCRLGTGTIHAQAAYELIELLEGEYGSDFMSEACDDADLQVTVEDDHGMVLYHSVSGQGFITLEV